MREEVGDELQGACPMQHVVSSWEERNKRIHEEKKRKEALVKRFTEHSDNREKFDCFVGEFVDRVLKSADKNDANGLGVEFEIFIDKTRRRKNEERIATSLAWKRLVK